MFYRFGVITEQIPFISGFLCIMQPVLLRTTTAPFTIVHPVCGVRFKKYTCLKGSSEALSTCPSNLVFLGENSFCTFLEYCLTQLEGVDFFHHGLCEMNCLQTIDNFGFDCSIED